MNERIRDLIERAYDIVPHERDWDTTTSVFNKEKFAFLIIQDCIEIVEPCKCGCGEEDVNANIIIHDIKEHFGIK